jgi:hypothetical protein
VCAPVDASTQSSCLCFVAARNDERKYKIDGGTDLLFVLESAVFDEREPGLSLMHMVGAYETKTDARLQVMYLMMQEPIGMPILNSSLYPISTWTSIFHYFDALTTPGELLCIPGVLADITWAAHTKTS